MNSRTPLPSFPRKVRENPERGKITDDLLPARELALDAGPFIVATVALPSHSPLVGDRLDVAVALGGIGLCVGAEHGIGTRWDDYHRSRMALVQGSL